MCIIRECIQTFVYVYQIGRIRILGTLIIIFKMSSRCRHCCVIFCMFSCSLFLIFVKRKFQLYYACLSFSSLVWHVERTYTHNKSSLIGLAKGGTHINIVRCYNLSLLQGYPYLKLSLYNKNIIRGCNCHSSMFNYISITL